MRPERKCITPSLIEVLRKDENSVEFHYYSDTDSLYIDLSNKPSMESQEVAPGIVLDFDIGDNLVGIDIDKASRVLDLSLLEMRNLPIKNLSVIGFSKEEELKLAEETSAYHHHKKA
ncbi:MAG: DUF2283 domain-containing protein [Candidatus Methanomethyliaceae archaeon]